ncbi:hypothetical protein JTE90_000821 [Oedothorax gibbosus]|uniref:WD repeat-containing protein 63 n=1 Tax=Oedothorax gibbosus TaxID=931172 RepID=A0AAV6VSU2_9ARAC|nr:hypothetical protein JTE90_000821 [Oedothorax gibbosus]
MATINESMDSNPKLANESSIESRESSVIVSETEKEIEDEAHNDFQPKIEVLVQLGKEDLRPFSLSDCYTTDRPGMHLEIQPKIIFDAVDEDTDIEEIALPKPIFRQIVDAGTQASVEFRSSEAQTLKPSQVNSWSQYEPRIFTDEEIKETLNNPTLEAFVQNAQQSILGTLVQNRIADSFFCDLLSLHDNKIQIEDEEELQLMIDGSFSCTSSKGSDRLISSIDWHPLHKDIFVASSINNSSLEERLGNLLESPKELISFYMWNVRNQFFSKYTLESLDDVYKLKFNPKLPNIISAGTVSGQLVMWDIKQLDFSSDLKDSNQNSTVVDNDTSPTILRYCAVSSMDHVHKHGITDLQWVPAHLEIAVNGDILKSSSSGCQIITCGLDGFLRIWDMRMGLYGKPGQPCPKKFNHLDGMWEPFHCVEVLESEGRKRKSLTTFSLKIYKKTPGNGNKDMPENNGEKEDIINPYENTEFYGGSDDGQVFFGSFKLMKDESGKFVAKRPEFFNSPHGASITSLCLSPFIEDIFFSTGGKNFFQFWKQSSLKERHTYVTAGQWSPTRAAVFVLGLRDGSVEIWDLLDNLYEPYVVMFMSTSAIESLSVQSVSATEHIIASGDSKGIVYTLNLPPALYVPMENEVEKFDKLLAKEAARILKKPTIIAPPSDLQYIFKLKPKEKLIKVSKEIISESKEDVLLEAYREYMKLQNEQLKLLGLNSKTDQV